MSRPTVWMRASLAEEAELAAAQRHFLKYTRLLTGIGEGDLVVARYSVLPFYPEVEEEVRALGARLLNTYEQHRFAADARRYAQVLAGHTPEVWSLQQALAGPEDMFVVKGETNSRKHLWKTHMFAANKNELRAVYARLLDDSLIGGQDIIVRPYVPLALATHQAKGVNGLPVTKEVRVFFLNGKEMARGFYWSEQLDEAGFVIGGMHHTDIASEIPQLWLEHVLSLVSPHIPFGVIDVAQTKLDGHWIVIEVNDGQMSGLSCVDPNELYRNIAAALAKN